MADRWGLDPTTDCPVCEQPSGHKASYWDNRGDDLTCQSCGAALWVDCEMDENGECSAWLDSTPARFQQAEEAAPAADVPAPVQPAWADEEHMTHAEIMAELRTYAEEDEYPPFTRCARNLLRILRETRFAVGDAGLRGIVGAEVSVSTLEDLLALARLVGALVVDTQIAPGATLPSLEHPYDY